MDLLRKMGLSKDDINCNSFERETMDGSDKIVNLNSAILRTVMKSDVPVLVDFGRLGAGLAG